ncbi:MAG: phosphatase PAP2 family protein [Spirochaetes bacterium]|nr:phosphatase PAP2 family protein [Spirochaetota bacterium]
MEYIWNTGIEVTLLAQGAGEWLLPLMQTASLLGTEGFYLVFLIIIYWCIDPRAGRLLGFMLLLSDSVNTFLKLLFHHPRPYWYSSRVAALGIENSFGLPSGHAQHSVTMWGTLALLCSGRKLRAALIIIIILISFSRIYLGVHFVTDVLLGWITGTALLFAVNRFFTAASVMAGRWKMSSQLLLAFLAAAALAGIQTIPLLLHTGWILPGEWMSNIAAAIPGAEMPDPRRISGIVSVSGAALGYGAGLALLFKTGGFHAAGSAKQRCARLIPGLIITVAIYAGLKAVLPQGDSLCAEGFRYLRYALTGLWITWGAPEMFIRLGLARRVR